MVIFEISYSFNGSLPTEQYGSLKSCVLVTTEFAFVCGEKFFVGHHYQTCMFVSFLEVISICENKRGGHNTFQSEPIVANVRSCSFSRCDTHLRCTGYESHLEIFKKLCKMLKISDQWILFCFSNFFTTTLGTCMCIHNVR